MLAFLNYCRLRDFCHYVKTAMNRKLKHEIYEVWLKNKTISSGLYSDVGCIIGSMVEMGILWPVD